MIRKDRITLANKRLEAQFYKATLYKKELLKTYRSLRRQSVEERETYFQLNLMTKYHMEHQRVKLLNKIIRDLIKI